VEPHLSPETIDRFAARTLDAAESALARKHLLSCPECRTRLRDSPAYPERARREAEVVAAMEERAGCPATSIRAAYATGAAEALKPERRAAITNHMRRCRACAGEIRALEAIRTPTPGQDGTQADDAPRSRWRLLWRRRR
jgi:hypothetical protein